MTNVRNIFNKIANKLSKCLCFCENSFVVASKKIDSNSLTNAKWLFVVSVVCISLVTVIYLATITAIEQTKKNLQLQTINEILPQGMYDNDLLATATIVDNELLEFVSASFTDSMHTQELGNNIVIYNAYKQNKLVAFVIEAYALGGFSGKIKLISSLEITHRQPYNVRLLGVRVLEHKETPGLGDKIEIRKSPWISSFAGHDLETTKPSMWQVSKQGGIFDSFAGATITPNAIIKACEKILRFANLYYLNNKHQTNIERIHE